jgi:hypothetical protein
MEYSEHVGMNLQLFGRSGEMMYLYNLIIAIKSLFIFTKPGKYFYYARLQLIKFDFGGSVPCNNDKVIMQRLVCQLLSEYFPQTAFNPVPNNSVPDFSAYRKSEPAVRQFVG